jgi:hypothetical protein
MKTEIKINEHNFLVHPTSFSFYCFKCSLMFLLSMERKSGEKADSEKIPTIICLLVPSTNFSSTKVSISVIVFVCLLVFYQTKVIFKIVTKKRREVRTLVTPYEQRNYVDENYPPSHEKGKKQGEKRFSARITSYFFSAKG